MGPTGNRGNGGGRLAVAQPQELPKSITFHDFCELTQRQLAEINLEKVTDGAEQPPIWRAREEDCIREEDEEEGEEEFVDEDMNQAGPSPVPQTMLACHPPRWQSLDEDSREETKKRHKKLSSGQRKRSTLNATFSSWLQLFLAKRRHRHNRYFSSSNGRHHGLMHQSCYDGLAGPNGGPLRSSVSLCSFQSIINHTKSFQINL